MAHSQPSRRRTPTLLQYQTLLSRNPIWSGLISRTDLAPLYCFSDPRQWKFSAKGTTLIRVAKNLGMDRLAVLPKVVTELHDLLPREGHSDNLSHWTETKLRQLLPTANGPAASRGCPPCLSELRLWSSSLGTAG